LNRVQLAVCLRVAFDRLDVRSVGLNGEDGARLHGNAVEQDGARAALGRIAAYVRARQTQLFTDEVHQKLPRLDLTGVPLSIDGRRDSVQAGLARLGLSHQRCASQKIIES